MHDKIYTTYYLTINVDYKIRYILRGVDFIVLSIEPPLMDTTLCQKIADHIGENHNYI